MSQQHFYLNEVKEVQQNFLQQAEHARLTRQVRQSRAAAGTTFRQQLGRSLVALGLKLARQPGVAGE